MEPSALGVDAEDLSTRQSVLSVEDPPVRQAGSKVSDVDELVSRMKKAGVV